MYAVHNLRFCIARFQRILNVSGLDYRDKLLEMWTFHKGSHADGRDLRRVIDTRCDAIETTSNLVFETLNVRYPGIYASRITNIEFFWKSVSR